MIKFIVNLLRFLKYVNDMDGWFKIFLPLKIFPTILTDFAYDIIAKNRYKIFGKREVCRIPTNEEKSKFL